MAERNERDDGVRWPSPVAVIERFIAAMPKAELHVHLEGTVRPRTLLMLAQKHGTTLPAVDEAGLADFFRFRNFPHFVEVYMAVCDCLRDAADFELIVREFGEDAARQNIRYLEVHFNPEPHVRKRNVSFAEMLVGMNRGRAAVKAQWGVEMRWIADGVRDAESGLVSVDTTVSWIAGLDPAAGVVALGLGGNEVGHPPGPFARAFARARDAGLHVVAHAGETTGPETIRASLRELHAERVGHGISAVDDATLVAELIASGIPLEVCPTSNVRTGVVATMVMHPFRLLDEAGVMVTVNSDDPALFGVSLTDEYRVLARDFGYGPDDLERISQHAVAASFLSTREKQRLGAEFAAAFALLRRRLGLSPANAAGGEANSVRRREAGPDTPSPTPRA